MQQNTYQETSRQQKGFNVFIFLSTAFFSLLLFFALGISLLIGLGFRNFYKNKIETLADASVVAIMPENQDYEKVMREFEKFPQVQETSSDSALYFEHVVVTIGDKISTNLLLQSTDKGSITYTKKSTGRSAGVVLPYIFSTSYGVRLSDNVAITTNTGDYTAAVIGFYEDEVLSQQMPSSIVRIYMTPDVLQQISEDTQGVPYEILSVGVLNMEETGEMITALQNEFEEQLFIGGLDLEIFNQEALSESIQTYLHYVKKVGVSIGFAFFLLAVWGLYSMAKGVKREKHIALSKRSDKIDICFYVFGTLLIGNGILYFGENRILELLISNLGYKVTVRSPILICGVSSVIYVLMAVLVLKTGFITSKIPRQKKLQGKVKVTFQFLTKKFAKNILAFLTVTIIALTIMLSITRLYVSIVGDTTLFYYYDESNEVLEVFHNTQEPIAMTQSFDEIVTYGKPMIQFTFFSLLLLTGILYVIILYNLLDDMIRNIQLVDGIKMERYMMPILKCVLWVSLLGFVIACILSLCLGNPMIVFLKYALGISIDIIKGNIGFFAISFFILWIITSGVTIATVR